MIMLLLLLAGYALDSGILDRAGLETLGL
jgi:hypothetical protein